MDSQQFTHITLPFLFDGDIPIDLSQVHDFDKRQQDLQILQTPRGAIALKRSNQENLVYKVRKFKHKESEAFFYKLTLESKLEQSYDPQTYFQDFHYPVTPDEEILQLFKDSIQNNKQPQNVPEVVPTYLIKPFSWHGSNFRIENLDRKGKRSIFQKKAAISIKFDDPVPTIPTGQRDERIMKLFEQRPVWLKSSLIPLISSMNIQNSDAELRTIAYYYSDGPWARCFVKSDYNPKVDQRAVHYQTILIINLKQEQDFQAVMKPLKNQSIYQICEMKDPAIQKIVNQQEKQVLTKKYGWLDRRSHRAICRLIKRQI